MEQDQAMIFDLDGTLIDSIEDLGRAVNYALTKQGYASLALSDYYQYVGSGTRVLCQRALRASLNTSPVAQQVSDTLAIFLDYYAQHCLDYTKPYPGITDLLSNLQARGHLLAVHSNKDENLCQKIVRALFPAIDFRYVSGFTADFPKKPDPQKLLWLVENLGKVPVQVYYVGDSEVDLATAENAKMPFLACAWGFRSAADLRAAGAKTLFSSPAELAKQLLS